MSGLAVPPSHPSIVGRALLVSDDSAAIALLTKSMQQFAITAEACQDLVTAATLVNTRKFEAIVVDLTLGDLSRRVLDHIRFSPSNQNSVTFAVAEGHAQARSQIAANFIIPKPVEESSVERMLKASLGLIIRDYRRYYRCPLSVPVLLSLEGTVRIPCEMINVSEGGLALLTVVKFVSGTHVIAEFTLPDESTGFAIEAEICWCDNKGRAGLHFRSISREDQRRLQAWLSRKIEEGIPEPIARLFQKAQ